MKWFEREFEVGLEPHLLGGIVERLRGTPMRLAERMAWIGVHATTRVDGSWSAQENAGHLLDLEELWLGRVDDLVAGRDALRPADLKNTRTHEADWNQRDPDALLSAFEAARAELVDAVEALTPQQRIRTAPHPRLRQPMSIVDLCFFVAEHDDHHLARITQLGRALGAGG